MAALKAGDERDVNLHMFSVVVFCSRDRARMRCEGVYPGYIDKEMMMTLVTLGHCHCVGVHHL